MVHMGPGSTPCLLDIPYSALPHSASFAEKFTSLRALLFSQPLISQDTSFLQGHMAGFSPKLSGLIRTDVSFRTWQKPASCLMMGGPRLHLTSAPGWTFLHL